MPKAKKKMNPALKAFLKKNGRFPVKGELGSSRSSSPSQRHRGGNHTAKKKHRGGGRSKGLFGTGLPKVGDMVQGAYGAEQLGGFDALAALTNPDIAVKDRLNSAYVAVRSKITAVGPIVNTVIGLSIINIGLKISRKVGGKYVRKWL